jgi:hypothetical protein
MTAVTRLRTHFACSRRNERFHTTLIPQNGSIGDMDMRSKLLMTAAAIGATVLLAAAPAQAQWRGHGGGWHGGGWRGGGWGGAGAGFVAGALVGGAIAANSGYYYGPYGYGYGGGYGPSYAYGPGYAAGYGPVYDDTYADDGYVAAPGRGYAAPGRAYASGDGASYCAQRYRSYNPRTGTYLGFDGMQHPCP